MIPNTPKWIPHTSIETKKYFEKISEYSKAGSEQLSYKEHVDAVRGIEYWIKEIKKVYNI